MKTITAHCLVKNEARFIWYSVMSVIKHVDKLLLWDTGSTDGTLEIIDQIEKADREKKVEVIRLKDVDVQGFAKVRQDMLDVTSTDWFIVVDGDEIWWEDSIKKVVQVVRSSAGGEMESIVVPTYNLVGDIYHYQEEAAGKYNLAGRRGHLNLRAVRRNIPGLHSSGPHGAWGWVDNKNCMIQDRDPEKVIFVDAPYLHATHLQRSINMLFEEKVPKRAKKLKHELGTPFPRDFYYPEVFFRGRPENIPSPWAKMSKSFKLRAFLETPARKIKRRVFRSARIGY
ncbi:MAG: glycosyltransferase family 2 protein [bacterium]|nr:glycosyltransferase family 2 protein [bacterium]